MLEFVITQINNLNDNKWAWFPFFNLQPKRNQLITFRHSVQYTAYYGLFFFIFLFMTYAAMFAGGRRPFGVQNFWDLILYYFVFSLAVVFLNYQLIIAPAWNYRARQLRKVKNDEVVTE